MTLSVSQRSAQAAALCAVAARVFIGLAVDMPTTRNGAWLAALLGGLLAAPLLIGLHYVKRRGLLLVALMPFIALDAANTLSALTRSAGYLALDRVSPLWIALPAALAALWCVFKNGDAIGYAAMIWARLALVLTLIVALLQCRYYRPVWLTPMLGEGWASILNGGVRAAGWIALASSVLLFADEHGSLKHSLWMLAGATGFAALLLVLAGMLTPTRVVGEWLVRLDDLLCNGRAPLYLQLPLIALWFAGLMHLLAAQCFAASACLCKMIRLDGRLCGIMSVIAIMALSQWRDLRRVSLFIAQWGFVAVASVTALALLAQILSSKGGRALEAGYVSVFISHSALAHRLPPVWRGGEPGLRAGAGAGSPDER